MNYVNMPTRQQHRLGLIMILMCTFIIFYLMMTNRIQLLNFYFYSEPSFAPKDDGGCDHLYHIAKKMLDGWRILLPFTTNDTLWKFYQGVGASHWKRSLFIWNSERKISNKIHDFISLYNTTKSKDIIVSKHFITFADNCCEHAKLKAVLSAIYPGGFDKTKIFDLNSMSAGFKKSHSKILEQSRGRGYWLWKPYVILKTLVENMNDSDIVMYQDAGAYMIQDAGPLLKLCEDSQYGILIFYLTFLEQHYTKRDAFLLFNMDNANIMQSFQRLASFMLFQKNCMSLQFVMEWLAYASDPQLITDLNNTLGKQNFPGFKEHRHDQSILSLLSKKWGLVAYRTPSQYGNMLGYKGGPYPQIIKHTRNRS